jgi:hypothetical protein
MARKPCVDILNLRLLRDAAIAYAWILPVSAMREPDQPLPRFL